MTSKIIYVWVCIVLSVINPVVMLFFPQMERDREMFAVNGSCFTSIQGDVFIK